MKIRLDKFIANNTTYTRTQVCKLIKQNIVYVNNQIVNDNSLKINPEQDVVNINDRLIQPLKNVYIAFNKPKGFLSTTSFYEEKPSVLELINGYDAYELHIIGRLDLDTTGLILITNDGDYTHHLKNPKFNIEKEYEVLLKKPLDNNMLKKLNQPLKMDGKTLKPFKITNINENKLNITITEGKYHQIKRIFEMIGNQVIELNRIRIGNLRLDKLNLKPSEYCEILKDEVF